MGADTMNILWAMLKFTNPVTGILMTAVQWIWKAISYLTPSNVLNPRKNLRVIAATFYRMCHR